MSAFDFDAGIYQGRIAGPNSTFVYELGHALPHQVVRLHVGDSNTITQTADYSTTPLTRALVKIRAPSLAVLGVSWAIEIIVGGSVFLTIPIARSREMVDIALPTLSASAASVGFRLVLQGTSGAIINVELPSVQIESVVLDGTTEAVVVADRDPEPGDVEVSTVPKIRFAVLSADGAAVATNSIVAYVDGHAVYFGGVAQGGWAATVVAGVDGPSRIVTLTTPTAFRSFTDVPVRVVYGAVDQSWSFRTVDTVGPSIVSITATDEREIRVVFSEAIIGPGQYTISLSSSSPLPAVTPAVVDAEMQADGSVLLTTDVEMTPNAVYELGVTGITDLLGNEIVDPFYAILGQTRPTMVVSQPVDPFYQILGVDPVQTIAPLPPNTFAGFAPAMPSGRDFDLYSMLLEHDREQDETGDLRLFVGCYQEVTNLVLCKLDRFAAKVVDPDSASEASLDQMLRDLGNPFPFDLTLQEKRKLVQLLVAIYKLKGTDQGIINAVRFFLGLEVTIVTPWRSGWRVGVSTLGAGTTLASGLLSDIYSYEILSPIGLTDEQRKRIATIARYMQRAPCHMRGIEEPSGPPTLPDHWQLGLSRVGVNTIVHSG